MLLRDNLQPTDFADAECRVTHWMPFEHHGFSAYRIWICRCTNFWFQRHEWSKPNANSTQMDGWIFSGYYPRRAFDAHLIPAPDMRDI